MDYPAAHSMDTMWFAVDADGHVAAFDTGEGGGVPEIAYVDDAYELADLIRELPEGGAQLDPVGHALGATEQHASLPENQQTMHVRAFISDLEPVKDLVARLSGTVLPATTGVAVRARRRRSRRVRAASRAWCVPGVPAILGRPRRRQSRGTRRVPIRLRRGNRDAVRAPSCSRQAARNRRCARRASRARDPVRRPVRRHAAAPARRALEIARLERWLARDRRQDDAAIPGTRARASRKKRGNHDLGSDYVVVNEVLERPDGKLDWPPAKSADSKKPWWKILVTTASTGAPAPRSP